MSSMEHSGDNLSQIDEFGAYLQGKISELPFSSSLVKIQFDEIMAGKDIDGVRLMLGNKSLYISRTDIVDAERRNTKLQVGRIHISNDRIIEFVPDSNTSIVEETFERLSQIPVFSQIREKYGINKPDDVSKERARLYALEKNKVAADKQAKIDIMIYLGKRRSLMENRTSLSVTEDELVLPVGQAELGILYPDNTEQYLETHGAGPCIIITFYNPETGTIGMSHIDSLTDEELVIRELINQVGKANIRVFGGDNSSIEQLISIKEILDGAGIEPLEWDILNSVKSIIIDKKTGNVFNAGYKSSRPNSTFQDVTMMQLRSFRGKQPAMRKFPR